MGTSYLTQLRDELNREQLKAELRAEFRAEIDELRRQLLTDAKPRKFMSDFDQLMLAGFIAMISTEALLCLLIFGS